MFCLLNTKILKNHQNSQKRLVFFSKNVFYLWKNHLSADGAILWLSQVFSSKQCTKCNQCIRTSGNIEIFFNFNFKFFAEYSERQNDKKKFQYNISKRFHDKKSRIFGHLNVLFNSTQSSNELNSKVENLVWMWQFSK